MWDYRVVVARALRSYLLKELHSLYMGIVRMKALARVSVWWPEIDSDIENTGKAFIPCLEMAKNPPKAILHFWTIKLMLIFGEKSMTN